jgi:hypothetical protein
MIQSKGKAFIKFVYFPIYTIFVRECCDGEKKNDLKILVDLHTLSPTEYKKAIFEMLSVCMYIYVDVCLTSAWRVEQICKIWGFHGGDYEECRLLGQIWFIFGINSLLP